jgi:hypothetical protein
MKSVAVHEEVPKEDAPVETRSALKKRHRGQHLTAERHGKPKEWTQGSGGSLKKLATTCRGMTCHAEVAWRKGHSHQEHGRSGVAPRTQNG